jgi:hypothetical protein
MEPDLDAFLSDESRNNDWWRSNINCNRHRVRRLRFLAYAQVSKRYMILTHLGSTTKLLLTVVQQDLQVLVATVLEKTRFILSRCME